MIGNDKNNDPEQQIADGAGKWISIPEAASLTPYSTEYLSLLARRGKLKAKKVGYNWFTTKEIVERYVSEQSARKAREEERWLSMPEAANSTPYSAEYLSLLARKGRLKAKKVGYNWFTTKEIVEEYVREQAKRRPEAGVPNLPLIPAKKLPARPMLRPLVLTNTLVAFFAVLAIGVSALFWTNNFAPAVANRTLDQLVAIGGAGEKQVANIFSSIKNLFSRKSAVEPKYVELADLEAVRANLRDELLSYVPQATTTYVTQESSPIIVYQSTPVDWSKFASTQVVKEIYRDFHTQTDRNTDLIPRAIDSFRDDIEESFTTLNISASSTDFDTLLFTSATGTNATTTNFFATTASTTNFYANVAAIGELTLGSGIFSNLLLNGSTTLQSFTFVNATGTNATTTNSYFSSSLTGPGNFIVNSSGSVGVGTVSPGSKLEVAGNIAITGADYKLNFGDGSSNIQRVSNDLRFTTSNIFSFLTGNVGIGTTTPNEKLEVNGGIITTGFRNGYAIPSGVFDYFSGNTRLLSQGPDATTRGGMTFTIRESDFGGALVPIEIQNDGEVIIGQDGTDVGIGVTDPQSRLHVKGDKIVLEEATTDAGAMINFRRGLDGADRRIIDILPSGSSGTFDMVIGQDSSLWRDFYLRTNGADYGIALKATTGRVGIGTSDPQSKLHVSGGSVLVNDTSANARVHITTTTSGNPILALTTNGQQDWSVGVDRSASGTFKISSDGLLGAPKLTIDTTGNITAADLAGSGNRCLYADSTGQINVKGFDCGSASGGDNLGDHILTQALRLTNNWISNDGGSEGIRITDAGFVGIGTNAADTLLTVGDPLSSTVQGLRFSVGNTSAISAAILAGQDATHNVGFQWIYNVTAANATADIFTYGYNNKLRVDASAVVLQTLSGGNVGIGTTTPAAKLNIAGGATEGTGQFRITHASAPENYWELGRDNVTTGGFMISGTNSSGVLTPRVTILPSSGNVGMGTSQNITNKMTLASSTHDVANGHGFLGFQNAGNGNNYHVFRLASDFGLAWDTYNGSSWGERLRVTKEGNVGIGTSTPNTLLHLYSTSVNGTHLQLQGADTGGNIWELISTGTNNGGGAGNLRFYNGTNGNGMTLTSAGNLGIGTTTPQSILEAVKNTVTGPRFTLTNTHATSLNASIRFANSAASTRNWDITTDYNGDGATALDIVGADGGRKMTLLQTGNVGIGTTTPSGLLNLYSTTVNKEMLVLTNTNTTAGASVPIFMASKSGGSMTNVSIENGAVGDLVLRTGATTEAGYGTTRMTVTAGGNVGIGTTTPSEKLTVTGSAVAVRHATSNNIMASIGQRGSGVDGGYMELRLAGTSVVGIDSNGTSYFNGGNVGIGESSPDTLLHVRGANASASAPFTGTSFGNIPSITIANSNGTANNFAGLNFSWDEAGSASAGIITQIVSHSTGEGNLIFGTTNSGGTLAERMRISSSGNVGIGATSPSTLLQVQGGHISMYHASDATSAGYYLQGFTDGGSTKTNKAQIGLLQDSGGARTGRIIFDVSDSGGTLNTRMQIYGSGKIYMNSGIGTGAGGNYLCIDTSTYEVLRGNGAACTASSQRFKQNIEDLDYGLEEILALRPVSYEYKAETNMGPGTKLGFIAEELGLILPEVVTYDNNGVTFGLDYPVLTAVLTKAVQELNTKIENIEFNITNASTSLTISTSTPGFVAAVLESINATLVDGVVNFARLAVGYLTVGEAKAERLCLGETCVTETELIQLLQNSGTQSASSPTPPTSPGGSPGQDEPEPAASSTEPVATSTPNQSSTEDATGQAEPVMEAPPVQEEVPTQEEPPAPAEEPAP